EEHPGHTFRANLAISPSPVSIVKLTIEPNIAAGLLFVQKLALTEGSSHVDVGTLVGAGDHRLVYRSEDVAVFENLNYAPRSFITHNAVRVGSDQEALDRMAARDFSGELLLADGPQSESDVGQQLDESAQIAVYQPEHVVVNAKTSLDGYLVLADAWDPGWVALLDGKPVSIHRADVVLRAVELSAGEHTVEFIYRPASFYAGLVTSAIGLAVLVIITLVVWLVRMSRRSSAPVI
ncbi:MAG: YfhO family protein, partial [Rudaea sp.]